VNILAIDLNAPATYFTIGPFSISMGNLTMIGISVALFVAALFLPFPGHDKEKR
jgi:hypothetical protein